MHCLTGVSQEQGGFCWIFLEPARDDKSLSTLVRPEREMRGKKKKPGWREVRLWSTKEISLSLSGSGTGLKLNNLISLCRDRQDTGNKGLLFLKPPQHFVIYRIMTSNSMKIALLSRRRLDEERRGFTAVKLCPGILEMKSILQYNWLNETWVVKTLKGCSTARRCLRMWFVLLCTLHNR